ncbi:MAG: hypothetical protein CVU55_15915 [Deltaproteobacteria bacterium HGW-Deltaproteobacteria-13]|jgi:hypothetical protein|nr:MAG: hypothetical protein CVU55_15915 [Deltaproteobacteria bacterium HGW-Deltaproteobacteria-13]
MASPKSLHCCKKGSESKFTSRYYSLAGSLFKEPARINEQTKKINGNNSIPKNTALSAMPFITLLNKSFIINFVKKMQENINNH